MQVCTVYSHLKSEITILYSLSQIRKTPGQDLAGRIAMAGAAVALVGFLAWSLATYGTASVMPSLP